MYKVPAGKGARSIVFHLGCAEIGLLNDYLLLFGGSKSKNLSDYHTKYCCCKNGKSSKVHLTPRLGKYKSFTDHNMVSNAA